LMVNLEYVVRSSRGVMVVIRWRKTRRSEELAAGNVLVENRGR
jgi:hypothetical protein